MQVNPARVAGAKKGTALLGPRDKQGLSGNIAEHTEPNYLVS